MPGHHATPLGSPPSVLVTAFSALSIILTEIPPQILRDPNSYQSLSLPEHTSPCRKRENTQALVPC